MSKRLIGMLMMSIILLIATALPAWASPGIIELIKPISDIKTVNKNIIISGWAEMDTTVDIKVYVRETQTVDGNQIYAWKEYQQPGQETPLVVGPAGFFAKELELKQGANKIVIKAVNGQGEEETVEGIVTFSSKDEVRKAVESILNTNILDIIKKIIN
jgi:hypothetical protein